jgi:hypothetical protein
MEWPASLYASAAPVDLAQAMYEARQHYYQLDGVPWEHLSSHFRSELLDEAKRWLASHQPNRVITGLRGKVIGAIGVSS